MSITKSRIRKLDEILLKTASEFSTSEMSEVLMCSMVHKTNSLLIKEKLDQIFVNLEIERGSVIFLMNSNGLIGTMKHR